MSSIKSIEQAQLRAQLNQAAALPWAPQGGWIRRVRKALGMSGAALSKRLGGSRSRAANLERYEREEGISLRNMREVAEAMGCRFVYAIIPPEGQSVEALVEAQARQRAQAQLADAAGHMALESQSLSAPDAKAELERITNELTHKPPRDFWDPSKA